MKSSFMVGESRAAIPTWRGVITGPLDKAHSHEVTPKSPTPRLMLWLIVFNIVLAAGAGLMPTTASATEAQEFGIESFSAQAINPDETLDVQAGSHPYEATVAFRLKSGSSGNVAGALKDLRVDLPPGFVGNPQALPACPQADFQSTKPSPSSGMSSLDPILGGCPADSQVGQSSVLLDVDQNEYPGNLVEPVYNLAPPAGVPGEFGFDVLVSGTAVPVVIIAGVGGRDAGYGLTTAVDNIATGAGSLQINIRSSTLTFWGVPADVRHDAQRGLYCLNGAFGARIGEISCANGGQPADHLPVPFLTNPTDCQSGELTTTLAVDSWEEPGMWKEAAAESPQPAGCSTLTFDPSIEVGPDETTQADEPSGYAVDLKLPQEESFGEGGIAPSAIMTATVNLPEGTSVSPEAADGLEACSNAQLDVASSEPGSCPSASQIGTVKVKTPLLSDPLEGAVFVGEPECSPCTAADAQDGHLFRIFIEVDGSGVVIKLPGTVSANPQTGRLQATFDSTPQLPFSDLTMKFTSGPRAPLTNPQACGSATTAADLTPWGAPLTAEATPSSSFVVDADGAGGACLSVSPFSPGFVGQTVLPNAGMYSPLMLAFSRGDREQYFSAIQLKTPVGLLGMLSHVSLCSAPQAQLGTCGAESQIGTTMVGAGSGEHPFYLGGRVYLTGPYDGAPFGLSIVVPAIAGPFNLGNVVVRAKINVDPHTAALTVTSSPLPQILDGVPLRLRTIAVIVDRPGFIFNATNCVSQKVTGIIAGAQGGSATVSSPYAPSDCTSLPFHPSLTAATSAKTSKADGASLTVKVVQSSGQAGIAKVNLQLPKVLPSRLTTLQKACTERQFAINAAGCPVQSVIGIAKVTTPVLDVPLVGPAILVSHAGAAFPDVDFVLQGQGVTIDLDGQTQIKSGNTYSKFETVPDAPISSFEAILPEGPDSVLAASLPEKTNGNMCGQRLVMPTTITAQNGVEIKQTTKLGVIGCKALTPLTMAQKLTSALKRCAKKKNKKRRTVCNSQAKKRYAPVFKHARSVMGADYKIGSGRTRRSER
jgi:hypothetical protein